MATYVKYTERQIVDALEACGFKRVKVAGTHETVMEREVEKFPDRRIRVLTSAVEGRDARACGKDALRVLVMVRATRKDNTGLMWWHVGWKAKRVHRTQNFLANLQERCRLAWKVATTRCPECKGMMVPRRHKGARKDTFWGCRDYPACRQTVSM